MNFPLVLPLSDACPTTCPHDPSAGMYVPVGPKRRVLPGHIIEDLRDDDIKTVERPQPDGIAFFTSVCRRDRREAWSLQIAAPEQPDPGLGEIMQVCKIDQKAVRHRSILCPFTMTPSLRTCTNS
jgi:hypothetical protein